LWGVLSREQGRPVLFSERYSEPPSSKI
jgi:hypothetical protein